MRLLICEADENDVKSALAHLKVDGGLTVKINPMWLQADPDEHVWVACGGPAVKMIQAAGWIPKKGGVEANRGKLFTTHPDGWLNPIHVGVTYAPQVRHIDVADFVHFQTDIALYRRFETTGSIEPKLGHYTYTPDFSGLIRYLKAKHALTGQPVELALDTETEGLDPFNPEKRIVSVQATAQEGLADVVYTYGMSWAYIQERIIPQLEWIASQPWIRIVGANFKYDRLWLRVKWGIVFKNFAFDTCNGGSLVDENRSNTLNLHTKIYSPDLGGYDDSFNRRFDKAKMGSVPKADLLPYAGGDTDACLRNYRAIRSEVLADNVTKSGKPSKNSLTSLYINIIHPALHALHKMELTGVAVDVDKFHAFGADLSARRAEATVKAASMLPKKLVEKYGGLDEHGGAPLSKPKMIAEYLFTPLGLNLKPTVTTEKTGAPSTSAYHLAQFKDHPEAGPLIERYLDFQSVSKMHGTYYEGFLKHLRSDNRWHASYIIHKQGKDRNNEQDAGGTVTGRGSATDPAFQCVGGDTEIMTPFGLRRADHLIDPVIPEGSFNPYAAHEMEVWGRGAFRETSNVFKSWRADRLRVVLKCGNEIICTPEHPIWMQYHAGEQRLRWAKAKDLHPGDQVGFPEKVARAPAPLWVTAEMAEMLGIVAAAGRSKGTLNVLTLEVPQDCAAVVVEAWQQAGVSPALEAPSGGQEGPALVHIAMGPDTGWKATSLALWIGNGGDTPIPYNLRGTVRWHDVFRGVFRALAFPYTGPKGIKGFRMALRLDAKPLALALIRETMLEGVAPPTLRDRGDRLELTWIGSSAGISLERAGLPLMGCITTRPRRKQKHYLSLEVVEVDVAEPGYVYDFTVPETHSFLANSMLVHNTVPKHSYWGKRLRECIVAPEGHVIVARDYSQGELKVTACWAGETKMIEAYQNGVDLHTLTAATVNGMTYEEAMYLKAHDLPKYEALRQNGKAGNFGLIYGMQAYGFMMYADQVYGVKLTLEQAEAMRDAFFGLYPGLVDWHDRQIMEAIATGCVRSPLGRLRHLPAINSPIKGVAQKAKNQAINSPIQATLVDMMWWAMGIMEAEQPELVTPCGQIHDQGLWYVREDLADEAVAYTGQVMENLPFEQKFGWKPELAFTTDAEVGYSLGALKKVGK